MKVSFSVCQGLDRLLQLGLEFGLGLPLGRPIVGVGFAAFGRLTIRQTLCRCSYGFPAAAFSLKPDEVTE